MTSDPCLPKQNTARMLYPRAQLRRDGRRAPTPFFWSRPPSAAVGRRWPARRLDNALCKSRPIIHVWFFALSVSINFLGWLLFKEANSLTRPLTREGVAARGVPLGVPAAEWTSQERTSPPRSPPGTARPCGCSDGNRLPTLAVSCGILKCFFYAFCLCMFRSKNNI